MIQNRDNIRRIMRMDSNGQMSAMLENAVKSGKVTYDQEGAVTYNRPATAPVMQQPTNRSERVVVNEEVMQKSNLPLAVLESFKKDPGTPMMDGIPTPPASVLDGLGLETLDAIRNETMQNESVQQPQQPSYGVQIDYSLIKTIINEAVQENVKKYVSAMSKKLINEGLGSGADNPVQAVKLGKSFSFITENGDVYEATLKYKTNLSEQTKKKTKKVI